MHILPHKHKLIHTYAHIQLHVGTHTQLHMDTYIYDTHIHINSCTHTYVHINEWTHVHMYLHNTRMPVYVYSWHMYTYQRVLMRVPKICHFGMWFILTWRQSRPSSFKKNFYPKNLDRRPGPEREIIFYPNDLSVWEIIIELNFL